MQLAITNVINVSVSENPAGLGEYNTSNLAIFSDETPANSFGTAGYSSYLSPTQVGIDFGTTSKTYAMAVAVFSQAPNILAGGGELIVILLTVATQHLAFSGTPASGTFVLNYGGNATAAINWNDSAAVIQTKLQAVTGLGSVVVTGTLATSLDVKFVGAYGVQPLLTVTANSLMTSGPVAITVVVTTSTPGETLSAAIVRTAGLIQYFGILTDSTTNRIGQTDVLAAGATVQALNKVIFFVSYTAADVEVGGLLDLITTGGLTQSRGLLYIGSQSYSASIQMAAAYASRGMSTDFSGSLTTSTMNLKDLATIQPDSAMTQVLADKAAAAGADIYASIQGVPKVLTSGANKFWDQVYNLRWFVGAIQIAGFNYLATVATKIPQTEAGMDGLKGAYRKVCQQAKTNGYCAPGVWNSPTTFGNQADLLANVLQLGYYIFSQPIGLQAQDQRVARVAPLVQIALKEAGAIQKSNVLININA